jgi:hypothetical protein
MNSIEITIIVEGQTEQTFVRDVLAPQMANKGIYLYPALIGKSGHKGGNIRFDRVKNDIALFLRQRNDTYISTMFDYFRIDSKWPGKMEVDQKIRNGATLTASHKAELLEAATHEDIVKTFSEFHSEKRFIPYIEMNEFEELLFSDANILAEKSKIDVWQIREIIKAYKNPEEINDDPVKSPSKRLETLNSQYRKVVMGKVIAEAIGIPGIRKQCSHFNDWLTKLEELKGNIGHS